METTTVRVDVQRLQILSDRIAQTLEAVNQLRLSAHNYGMSHWGARPEFTGIQNSFGYNYGPMANPYSQTIAPFGFSSSYPSHAWGMAAPYAPTLNHGQIPSYNAAFGSTFAPLF